MRWRMAAFQYSTLPISPLVNATVASRTLVGISGGSPHTLPTFHRKNMKSVGVNFNADAEINCPGME